MSSSDETLIGTVRRLFGRHDTGGSVAPETPLPEDVPDSLRDCPGCGEQVHVYAVRCRHCGRDLELRAG